MVTLSAPARGGGAARRPTVVMAAPLGQEVVAQDGAEIVIWNAQGEQLARFAGHTPFRGSLAAGKLAGVFDEGLGVRFGKAYAKLLLLDDPPALVTLRRVFLSANGQLVAALHRNKGLAGHADTVSFWNANTGRKKGMTHVMSGRRLLEVALAKKGRLAVVCGDRERREVFCRSLRIRKKVRQVSSWRSAAHRTVYSLDVGPSSTRVAVSVTGEILVFSLPQLKLLTRKPVSALSALFPPQLRRLLEPFPSAHVLRFSPGGDQLFTFHGTKVVGVGRWALLSGRRSGLTAKAWLPRPRGLHGAIKELLWGPKGAILLFAGAGGVALQRYEGNERVFHETLRFVPRPNSR